MIDKELKDALKAIDRYSDPQPRGGADRNLSPKELCTAYGKIREPLAVCLRYLVVIPAIGKVAVAIELLMKLADSLCPVATNGVVDPANQ